MYFLYIGTTFLIGEVKVSYLAPAILFFSRGAAFSSASSSSTVSKELSAMLLTTVPTAARLRYRRDVDQMEATQVTSRNLDRGTLPFLPFSREGPHASEAV